MAAGFLCSLLLMLVAASGGEEVTGSSSNPAGSVEVAVDPLPPPDDQPPVGQRSFYCIYNGAYYSAGDTWEVDLGNTGTYSCQCIDLVGPECVYQDGSHTCALGGANLGAGEHALIENSGWLQVCSCPDVIDPNGGTYTIPCTTPPGGHRCTSAGVGYYPGESWTYTSGSYDYTCECPSTASAGNPNYVTWNCGYSSQGNTCTYDGVDYLFGTEYEVLGFLGWTVRCTCGVAGTCTLVDKKHTCFSSEDGQFYPRKTAFQVDVEGATYRCSCPKSVSSAVGDPILMDCNPVPSVCLEPKAKGSCAGSEDRYFYKQSISLCRRFTYTGCGGNNNNFMTKAECQSLCLV